jgi:hypothetical protein
MHLNEESADKWTAKGDVNSLLKTMQSWAPVWKDLFAYVNFSHVVLALGLRG